MYRRAARPFASVGWTTVVSRAGGPASARSAPSNRPRSSGTRSRSRPRRAACARMLCASTAVGCARQARRAAPGPRAHPPRRRCSRSPGSGPARARPPPGVGAARRGVRAVAAPRRPPRVPSAGAWPPSRPGGGRALSGEVRHRGAVVDVEAARRRRRALPARSRHRGPAARRARVVLSARGEDGGVRGCAGSAPAAACPSRQAAAGRAVRAEHRDAVQQLHRDRIAERVDNRSPMNTPTTPLRPRAARRRAVGTRVAQLGRGSEHAFPGGSGGRGLRRTRGGGGTETPARGARERGSRSSQR
jgi:hypothetical protein